MNNTKIKHLSQLKNILRKNQAAGKRIVFTNGCFDLLHYGHITYLAAAKKLGDILVVGLNSDASVRRLKGKNRPVHSQAVRAKQLAALEDTDYITVFNASTPYNLIKAINPDILVKGADWAIKNIVGSDWVIKNKGQVRTIAYEKGFSTTALIEKIKQL